MKLGLSLPTAGESTSTEESGEMVGRVGGVGLLMVTLLLALPLPSHAGSSRAALAVSVVVSLDRP